MACAMPWTRGCSWIEWQKGPITLSTLWCGLGGYNYYPREDQKAETESFLDRCASAGVRSLRFYWGFGHRGPVVFRLWRPGEQPAGEALAAFELHGERQRWDPFEHLVTGAHELGIEIWGYTSPAYQGALQPNPHSPVGERLPFLFLAPFANEHPEYWARDRQGLDGLMRQGYVILSLAFPEVRNDLVEQLTCLVLEAGLDGLELEWLTGPESTSPYGFEEPSTDGSACVTGFVDQMRRALGRRAKLSCAVPADLDRARGWMIDWPDWGQRGLVDQLVLRLRGRDPKGLEARIRAARRACGDSVWLIAQLDCWHADGWRDAGELVRAADVALAAGANEAGLYRADSVQVANLWPAVEQMGTR
jgi:hypothetical protein